MPPLLLRSHLARRAFTLVELLVVMAIIVLMLALVAPALRTNTLDLGLSGIAGTLEQARAYAMANDTYVYVGIVEVDAAQAASVKPQAAGKGRVAVATVASRNGMRGYGLITPESDWTSGYNGGSALMSLGKLQSYDNLHIADTLDGNGTPPTSGPMVRPSISDLYRIGSADPNSVSFTTFDWPLGSATSAGQYHFTKVIQFDPQGVARMPRNADPESIVTGMEISLQPSHGNLTPAAPASSAMGNHAVIQLDAVNGAVHIYRP